MWKWNKNISLIIVLLFIARGTFAQDCHLSLSGKVVDHETEEGLAFVNVYIIENSQGAVSDENGEFTIKQLCPGTYHIIFSHIGCDPEQKYVVLDSSQFLTVHLEHTSKLLEGVVVTGHHVPRSTQNTQAISAQSISDHMDDNLSNMLEDLSGVHTLKNGSGISKPVIHGLYGNRLTILNNGVVQSGQQWGNDHSPEIDPLVANRISVIKGVSALEYPGSNLGSIIMVEPSRLKNEPHLHGSASYSFSSNGRGSAANLQLYSSSFGFEWKVNGTLRKSGDKHTSSYFLTNSGMEEGNVSLQIEKSFSEKLSTSLYFSSFNTEIGVLRGSHIGNLTDLENAFIRTEPYFTSDKFSYAIEAPQQKVHHHLLKSATKMFLDESQWLEFNISAQFNNRKEFDVRRSGRSEIPALSLQQWTYFGELKYNIDIEDRIKLKAGIQLNAIDNTNNPETGILPLIPDYLSYEAGTYLVITKNYQRSLFEAGLRYDFIYQDVPTISNSTPYEIIRYENEFNNLAASLGWKYDLSALMQTAVNIGYAARNPAINELYSGGLHQGVSGIEEGNPELQQEQSLKSTISLQVNDDENYALDALFYYQRINDYIYLLPSGESRLTIRGAFPVFIYDQVDAELFGADFSGQFNLNQEWKLKATYSYIQGNNIEENNPLIYVPSNRIFFALSYHYDGDLEILNRKLENLECEINNRYVFKQNRFLEEQDFLPPPDGYNLLGVDFSGDLQVAKKRLRVYVRGDNLLNNSYRDYLDRQRYFADGLGINITAGLRMKF